MFALLTATCGLVTRLRSTRENAATAHIGSTVKADPELPMEAVDPGMTRQRVATWVMVSFLPSALMLAVTSHVSTDVAAIPLLWVVPLAIYLATFVLAFARTTRTPPAVASRFAVLATLVSAAVYP